MKPAVPERFSNDPAFLRVMADAISIQHRFSAEPVYAKTGVGFLRSEGTEELERIKEESARIQESPESAAVQNS